MTFNAIKAAVKDYCGLTQEASDTRVGSAINRHYRRITSSIGMDASRFVTRSVSTTIGSATVTFTEIEKIDRVIDATDSTAIQALTEVSLHELRATQPGDGSPTRYALQNTDADAVTIRLDTVPQVEYDLQADGWTTVSDLSGVDEPVFPESFHDVLVWSVISEELLKKEKDKLAAIYAKKAEDALAALRFHLADSPTRSVRQGGGIVGTATGSAGGAGSIGGTAYTQSALITFDRGAGVVPFAVARSDAPYVVNLGAEFLGNITTDRLIGRDTAGTGESEQLTVTGGLEFTGTGGIRIADSGVTTAKINDLAVTTAKIDAAAVTTAKIATDSVTYAQMQNVASASRLLGRGSAGGSGDVQEMTATSPLSISSTALVVDSSDGQFLLAMQIFGA